MINRSHPDFPKYKAECETLRDEYIQRCEMIDKTKLHIGVKDGKSVRIDKEFGRRLTEIQKKYFYLFE